jgi:hypothetical protein
VGKHGVWAERRRRVIPLSRPVSPVHRLETRAPPRVTFRAPECSTDRMWRGIRELRRAVRQRGVRRGLCRRWVWPVGGRRALTVDLRLGAHD